MRSVHRVRTHARQGGLSAVISGLALLALTGCAVDFDATDSVNVFSCFGDDDCLAGFVCVQDVVGEVGVCQTEGTSGGTNCFDRDQDGYLSGPGCAGDGPFDCNDDPEQDGALINPGRDEDCNAIDDDCDGDTDEELAPRACPLQAGVCSGSVTSCIGGEWVDCSEAGLYGPNYTNVTQENEACDGLDNNCSGGYSEDATAGEIDPHCSGGVGRCIPGDPPQQCGTETGTCDRGVRFCLDNGFLSPCVEASPGAECSDDSECGANGFCVDENLDYREDLQDGCALGSEPACSRSTCRVLTGATTCANDDECGEDESCLFGSCQATARSNEDELCNGLDDDCNGRIDDGADCGRCPFNMVLLNIQGIPSGICVDMYEASRPDASDSSAGTNELYAVTQMGTIPWTGIASTDAADQACRGAAINDLPPNEGGIPGHTPEKFLCESRFLEAACGAAYPYGEAFVAGACNDSTTGTTLQAAGASSTCCTAEGVCDLSGNANELVVRPNQGGFGGSAEQTDADVACEFTPIAPGSPGAPPNAALGFRCCATPLN